MNDGGCGTVPRRLIIVSSLSCALLPVTPRSLHTVLRFRIYATAALHAHPLPPAGTPEEPRCGFSRKVVDALRSTGTAFGTFDILSDQDVRARLKVLELGRTVCTSVR